MCSSFKGNSLPPSGINQNAPNNLYQTTDDTWIIEKFKASEVRTIPHHYMNPQNIMHMDAYSLPAKLFYTIMNEVEKGDLIHKIIYSLKHVTGINKDEIIYRQLCHFFRVDMNFGVAIAKGLGIDVDETIMYSKS